MTTIYPTSQTFFFEQQRNFIHKMGKVREVLDPKIVMKYI